MDGNGAAWCYTMNPELRTWPCGIPWCPQRYTYYCQSTVEDLDREGMTDYFYGEGPHVILGNSYRGMRGVSVSGKPCINWLAPRLLKQLKAMMLVK